MNVLIEFYDGKCPYNNNLACRLLKPDKMIMLGSDEELSLKKARDRFRHIKRVFALRTEAEFKICSTYDLAETVGNLQSIIGEYGEENCVIDTIGGSETLLLAAGACITEFPGIRIMGIRNSVPVWIWGGTPGDPIRKKAIGLSVRDVISAAAGEMKGRGHISREEIDGPLMDIIPAMFDIYTRHREEWPYFTFYMHKLYDPEYQTGKGGFKGPAEFTLNPLTGNTAKANFGIIRDLYLAGILSDYSLDAAECMLEFPNPGILPILCDIGSWVELFVYYCMKTSRLFSDVEIDPIISWDNDLDDDDTLNEVDVIAVRGVVPVFVSCKAGYVSTAAVNEIMAITNRFGNGRAKAVLVTASDPETDAYAVKKRAEDNGLLIIDRKDLTEDKLIKKFRALFNNEKDRSASEQSN